MADGNNVRTSNDLSSRNSQRLARGEHASELFHHILFLNWIAKHFFMTGCVVEECSFNWVVVEYFKHASTSSSSSAAKIKISRRRKSQIRDEVSTFIKVNQKDFFLAVSEIGKKFNP